MFATLFGTNFTAFSTLFGCKGTTKFADMQIFEVKSENGKVKGERLEVRGGNKTERHMSAARFGIDMWYCYISVRLTDLCTHSIVGLAVANDEELTIA